MEVRHLSEEDVSGIREALPRDARSPRVLCWKCKRLTPFAEDRCEFCGARFAGSTGGVYRPAKATLPVVPPEDMELVAARRSLLQLFEDLQRVHDVSSTHHYDPVRHEETITLFQCPSCGRFVGEDATDCLCGVRFAAAPDDAVCPECGSRVEGGPGRCPVCSPRAEEIAYACPLCGAEVSEDAVRCVCGARFEA